MKYYFWILGCAMNYSDAERMAAIFDSMGHTRTFDEKEANIFVVISCSVRESAILRIYGKVKDLKNRKDTGEQLTTILTGCVLDEDRKKFDRLFDLFIETKDMPKLPGMLRRHSEFISESLGYRDTDSGYQDDKVGYFAIKPHYESTFRAFVPISTGCDNFCSYCAVPYTKGREKSRPLEEVVAEVKSLIENDYKEITLVGQNVNSYGNDLNTTVISTEMEESSPNEDLSAPLEMTKKAGNNPFIDLIKRIDAIPGEYRVYFYSNHPKDMTDKLITTLAELVHFPHYIHLPLQSGNDEVLRKMNRHNTKNDYLRLVEKIRQAMPDVNLTTDIIVGYPGETDEQLGDTAEVMRKAEYDMAFIAQYSPRSGTVSAKQEDNVSKGEKKRREAILQEIVKASVLTHNQELVGTIQRVLIDEEKKGKYYGRTAGYKVVEIKTGQPLKVGQFIDVKIECVSSWKLFGLQSS